MKFELLPVIDIMLDLYEKPATVERFHEYLQTLQGETKGDLSVPIGGFNPMAKEYAITKLRELKKTDVEKIIAETLQLINEDVSDLPSTVFKVALNLADDLKGGWTNHFATDYDSKFKMNALIKRSFCIPVFWTSEDFNQQMIIQRTKEYCYRTVYRLAHDKPKTLKDHIDQEIMVAKRTGYKIILDFDFNSLNDFYEKNKDCTEWITIFNFLYGDNAVESLGNIPLGIKEDYAGFKFARYLAIR
ncbi:MAG: hypothetical protein JST96_04905 [Bacteroidetes bacterium]|nr:hypothetical protein [Bacteroidota bacterium]